MPTAIPKRYRDATRGQLDDHRIARGQIELVDMLVSRLSSLRDRLKALLIRPQI